jgi:NMD protein affecting ribosome stability and mRNA decay
MKRRESTRPERRDRLIQDARHDPYRSEEKPPEPTTCPECGVVFREGRWRWGSPAVDAVKLLCPACRRTRDGYPAGELTVSGEFLAQHREEIRGLLRNVEEREKEQHPLHRIMALEEKESSWVATTTDVHLARKLGEALHAAYGGEVDYHYPSGEQLLRVTWLR